MMLSQLGKYYQKVENRTSFNFGRFTMSGADIAAQPMSVVEWLIVGKGFVRLYSSAV